MLFLFFVLFSCLGGKIKFCTKIIEMENRYGSTTWIKIINVLFIYTKFEYNSTN